MDKNQQTVTAEGNAPQRCNVNGCGLPQGHACEHRSEAPSLNALLAATAALKAQDVLQKAIAWRRAVVAPHRYNLNAAEVDLAIAIDVWNGGAK